MSDVTAQATINHELTMTTPDDPAAENRPSHWNATHVGTVVVAATALFGAFSNANGMSFGTSDGGGGNTAITGSYTVPSVPAQSVQTQPAGNIAGAGFTSTTTAGVDVKATHDSAGLSMAVPAYITTQSVQTQASGNLPRSGFTTTTIAGDVIAGTHDTDGLKLAVPAYLTAAAGGGLTNIKVSAGTLSALRSDITFNNSNGVSFGLETNGIITGTVKTDYLTTQSVQTQASGNIPRSGFTTTTVGGAVVAGTHDTDGLKLAVPAYLTTARASTDAVGLNTAQTNVTWTVNSSGLSFNAGGYAGTGTSATNASITLNTNGLAISVAAPGGGAGKTASMWHNVPPFAASNFSMLGTANGTLLVLPLELAGDWEFPAAMTASTMFIKISGSVTATVSSSSNTVSVGIGIYTLANSTQLSLLNSVLTTKTQAAGTTNSAAYNGGRWLTVHSSQWSSQPVFVEGSRYWIGVFMRVSNLSIPRSWMGGQLGHSVAVSGDFGVSTATAASRKNLPFLGFMSVSTSAVPGSIAASAVFGTGLSGPFIPYVLINNTFSSF